MSKHRLASLIVVAWIALAIARPEPAEAQVVAVSPRIVWIDAYFTSQRSVMTSLLGMRATVVRGRISPFGGLYLRGTEVTFSGHGPPPSGGGVHTVVGASVEGGRPGGVRPHAALGAGVVFWRNQNWGNRFFGELEAGFDFPLSTTSAITLAGRVERMRNEPTLWGGTLGASFRLGG